MVLGVGGALAFGIILTICMILDKLNGVKQDYSSGCLSVAILFGFVILMTIFGAIAALAH